MNALLNVHIPFHKRRVMSPGYKPLSDVDFNDHHEHGQWEPQARQKSYTKTWAIALIVILAVTNIATIFYFRTGSANPDLAPLDYGTFTQDAFLDYKACH
jgi:hypothetical protein